MTAALALNAPAATPRPLRASLSRTSHRTGTVRIPAALVDAVNPGTVVEMLPVRALVGFLSLRPKGATASVAYMAERLGCGVAAVERGLTANYAAEEITSQRTEKTAVRRARVLEAGERYVIVPMGLVGALRFHHTLLYCLIKRRRMLRKSATDAALAEVTGWSVRRVVSLRRELEAAGWMSVDRIGRENVYALHLRPMQAVPAASTHANAEGSEPANAEGSLYVVTSPIGEVTREALDDAGVVPSVEDLSHVGPTGTEGQQAAPVEQQQAVPAASAAAPASMEPIRVTEGVRLLVELGKVCKDLRLTGKTLWDQGRRVDQVLAVGWKRDQIRHELLRPYPAQIRVSVAAIISRRLLELLATPAPDSVMAPPLPGRPWGDSFALPRETYTAPRYEEGQAQDWMSRRFPECEGKGGGCGLPTVAGELCDHCAGRVVPLRPMTVPAPDPEEAEVARTLAAVRARWDAEAADDTPDMPVYTPAPLYGAWPTESERLIGLDPQEWNR